MVTKSSIAARGSLIALAVMLAAGPVTAFAQTAEAPAPAPVDAPEVDQEADQAVTGNDIVITGTSIRGMAPVGSTLISVGRDEIDVSPAINTASLLRETPQVLSLGVSDGARTTSSGSKNIVYGNAINLRGVSAYATLTLLNGRRMVPVGTVGGTVDPSAIPSIALQRIEIVADGSSAIYGSDAVTGVANLILRRNVNGAEFNVQRGFADDYHEFLVSGIAGHSWEGGQITIGGQHSYRTALRGLNRDFYEADLRDRGGADYRLDQCSPGTITIGGINYPIPSGTVTRATLVPGAANRCNPFKNSDLIPQQEINNGVITFDQRLGESVRFYADGYYSKRNTLRRGTPGFQNLTVPRSNAFFVAPAGTNPATETIRYSFSRERPYSTDDIVSDAYQFNAGLDIDLGSGWNLDLNGGYGRSSDLDDTQGFNVNAANLAAALASGNPATAFNPYGTTVNSQAVVDSVFDFVQYTFANSRIADFRATLDGTLFELPGGPVRVAIGGEYYGYKIRTGRTNGTAAVQGTVSDDRLKRNVSSAYAEIAIPIFGEANATGGFQSLDITFAGRLDKYSDVGTTKNPKVGVNWVLVTGLKFHGSYGTSFRAPLLTQIVNPGSGLYINTYFDPTLNNGAGGNITGIAESGGDPNLSPETARTWSAGIDYELPFSRGARLSINYFDLVYENQIESYLNNRTVLLDETLYAPLLIRAPGSSFIQSRIDSGLPVFNGTAATALAATLYVDGRQKNLGTTITRGIDFQLTAPIQTASAGDFRLGLVGTYLFTFKTSITQADEPTDKVNLIDAPQRFRFRGSLGWSLGGFRTTAFLNYVNAYKNNLSTLKPRISPWTSVDLNLSYTLNEGARGLLGDIRLGLDVTNLFDRDPPFADYPAARSGAGGGYDAAVASPLGRLVSLSLSKKF